MCNRSSLTLSARRSRALLLSHLTAIVKLENILFKNMDRKADEIKVIDFGLATKYLSEEYKHMHARVGTLYYMSPQVLERVYDSKCDLVGPLF